VSRLKDAQKEIYYLVGPSREAIEAGPYLEVSAPAIWKCFLLRKR